MGLDLFIFIFLIIFTLFSKQTKKYFFTKPLFDWIIDSLNLAIQGLLIPVLGGYLASKVWPFIFPTLENSLAIAPFLAFLINFFLVDYLYYWNHRIFHFKSLFPIHLVHHSVTQMDIMATSRNTLWTSFLIVYLWINSIFIFLLKDPTYYIVAMSISASLDLWKHSRFLTNQQNILKQISNYFCIMTPIEHAWHHSHKINCNYGANLNIFDKIHGTYYDNFKYPEKLGINNKLNFYQKLFNPF